MKTLWKLIILRNAVFEINNQYNSEQEDKINNISNNYKPKKIKDINHNKE